MISACQVDGCQADARGAAVCARHWDLATPDEVAALRHAAHAPLHPKGELAGAGVSLQQLEYDLALAEVVAAIADREPPWRRARSVA